MYGLTNLETERLDNLIKASAEDNTFEKLYERADNLRVQADKLENISEYKQADKLRRKASDMELHAMRKERLKERRKQ